MSADNPFDAINALVDESHPSPNHGSELDQPTLIVMHYTAGTTLGGAVSWLCNPAAKASAHFVIDRDGAVAKLINLHRQAWHAGRSSWQGRAGVNAFSVGIELVNVGWLSVGPSGGAVDAYGRAYLDEIVEVSTGSHRLWAAYTDQQIQTAAGLCAAIMQAVPSITDIVGHEHVSPGRKVDPGPAFPWAPFRALVEGRDADDPADQPPMANACPSCGTPLRLVTT